MRDPALPARSRPLLFAVLLPVLLALVLPAAIAPASAVPTQSPVPSTPAPASRPPAGVQAQASPTPAAATVTWFHFNERTLPNWWLVLPDAPNTNQFILSPKGGVPTTGESKRIFVLYSRSSSVFDLALNALLDGFTNKRLAATFTVVNYFDDPVAARAALAAAAAGHYDLIYAMGSDVLLFMNKNFAADTTPVVSVSNKDPVLLGLIKDYTHGSGSKYAYTSVNVPMDLEMAYLLQLKPNLKNIVVMYEQNNISAVQTQVEPMRQAATAHGVLVIDVKVIDNSKAKQELVAKVPQALATILQTDPQQQDSLFWITGSTSVFNNIATINQYADHVPVLSIFPELVQPGEDSAVLSVGVSYETNGYVAALYGIQILRGQTTAGALPVGVVAPPDIAISFHKAREIGLKIPFSFFESASFIYDADGQIVRKAGQTVPRSTPDRPGKQPTP